MKESVCQLKRRNNDNSRNRQTSNIIFRFLNFKEEKFKELPSYNQVSESFID